MSLLLRSKTRYLKWRAFWLDWKALWGSARRSGHESPAARFSLSATRRPGALGEKFAWHARVSWNVVPGVMTHDHSVCGRCSLADVCVIDDVDDVFSEPSARRAVAVCRAAVSWPSRAHVAVSKIALLFEDH